MAREKGISASTARSISDAPILRWRFELRERGEFRVAVRVVVSVVSARLRRGGLPRVGVGDLAELIQDLVQQCEVAGAQVDLPLRKDLVECGRG